VTEYAVLSPVTDGEIVRYRDKAIWVQCPDCGPRRPRVKPHFDHFIATVESPKDAYECSLLTCSNCGEKAPYRKAKIPTNGKGKCGSKCWNGKTICACICAGKCHGEGKCRGGHEGG
jgi:hypothetical protein